MKDETTCIDPEIIGLDLDRVQLEDILDRYVTADGYEAIMDNLLLAINSGSDDRRRDVLADLGTVISERLAAIPFEAFKNAGSVCRECSFAFYRIVSDKKSGVESDLKLMCTIKTPSVEVSPFNTACPGYSEKVKQ